MTPDDTKLMPSTLISKRDYGIKIAKLGYDVNYASDTELLYNSSFPVLAIANYINDKTNIEVLADGGVPFWNGYDGSYSTRYMYSFRVLHGLSYVPMVLKVNFSASEFNAIYNDGVKWDDRYIYVDYYFFTQSAYNDFVNAGKKIKPLVVFAVDIERDVEYPYFDYAVDTTSWGSSNDYGFKYILAGDEDNLNLNELGLNPNIQSLMVTAVKVANNGSSKNTYVPIGIDFDKLSAFDFYKFDGTWTAGGESSLVSENGYRAMRQGGGKGYFVLDRLNWVEKNSLVVVRLPFIAPDVVTYDNFKM